MSIETSGFHSNGLLIDRMPLAKETQIAGQSPHEEVKFHVKFIIELHFW